MSSRPRPRLSDLPPAPKPPCRIHQTVVISDAASLTGTFPITIGANSVIHPRAKLNSTAGPITIGEYCIINERATIAAPNAEGCTIEGWTVVETNAVVEAKIVGEGGAVEVGVKIGKCAVLGRNCKITPLNRINEREEIEDDTVIYGMGQRRTDVSGSREARRKLTERHVEGLRGLFASNREKFMS